MKKRTRPDVGRVRREQIVEAAVAVIAERGLQHLSLSAVEQRAGMSRGQLTYYFPAKEDILLAVFDRLLALTYERIGHPAGAEGNACEAGPREWIAHLLRTVLRQPPANPEFSALQYTFLAQIGHREDFRRRLAQLYEEWRGNMAGGFAAEFAAWGTPPRFSPRALATFFQALLHGLSMQRDADPGCYDLSEMVGLCLDVLSSYLQPPTPGDGNGRPPATTTASANGSAARGVARRSPRSSRVKHE
jgi:AcrR family transcriptional regulator